MDKVLNISQKFQNNARTDNPRKRKREIISISSAGPRRKYIALACKNENAVNFATRRRIPVIGVPCSTLENISIASTENFPLAGRKRKYESLPEAAAADPTAGCDVTTDVSVSFTIRLNRTCKNSEGRPNEESKPAKIWKEKLDDDIEEMITKLEKHKVTENFDDDWEKENECRRGNRISSAAGRWTIESYVEQHVYNMNELPTSQNKETFTPNVSVLTSRSFNNDR